jgi:predicted translation initiation factor SUI1
MAQRTDKTVLFLCTGNYYRSRFAEIFFNSVADKMGLSWRALSRGLALERGVRNVGPIAVSAIKTLETMGVRTSTDFARFPTQVTMDDLAKAHYIVALKEAEHLPLLVERFPTWIDKVEFWDVDDTPVALTLIEREVMDLTARLIGGGQRQALAAQDIASDKIDTNAKKETKGNAVVRVGRETKGRRGKGVTTVSDVPLDEAGMLDLAAKLKQRCGTGGTVKDGRIEIQGDQRARLVALLEGMGYRVKRAGG